MGEHTQLLRLPPELPAFWDHSGTDQLHQVVPVVLSQQPEGGQQGPAEGGVAGVAIVWVGSCIQTGETLRAAPEHVIRDLCLHDIVIEIKGAKLWPTGQI